MLFPFFLSAPAENKLKDIVLKGTDKQLSIDEPYYEIPFDVDVSVS